MEKKAHSEIKNAKGNELIISYNGDNITITLKRGIAAEPLHPDTILKLVKSAELRLSRFCIDKGVPEDQYVVLVVIMSLILNGMYLRAEMGEPHEIVFSASFDLNICRFTAYDNNYQKFDFQDMLSSSKSVKETDVFLKKLCDEVMTTSDRGIKYSGSFAFVPVPATETA